MANEYIRKEWSGGVTATTLNASINATATVLTLTDGSTFPVGTKPFVLVLNRGAATEEKILCSSRTVNNVTVLQRGYDGSTAQSHAADVSVEHALDAYTIDQANAMANTMTTAGDIIYKTATGDNTSYGRLAIGSSGLPLTSTGTVPAWSQLAAGGIATGAVTAAKVNSDVAGLGLVKNGTSLALDVNVDGSTLEIASDTVRVKDGGITTAKLAAATLSALLPAGAIIDYGGSAAPSGWVLCDGTSYSSTNPTYAALFAAIGTTYGGSAGNFNVPDLRGRVAVGKAASGTFATLAATGGAETVTLTTSQIPSHQHTIDHDHASVTSGAAGTHAHTTRIDSTTGAAAEGSTGLIWEGGTDTGGTTGTSTVTSSAGSHSHTVDLPNFTGSSGLEGGGTAHTNLQPYIVTNKIIKL